MENLHKAIRTIQLSDSSLANHYRITHARDLIPLLPPSFSGFKHTGDEVLASFSMDCSIGIMNHLRVTRYAPIQKAISVSIAFSDPIPMIMYSIWGRIKVVVETSVLSYNFLFDRMMKCCFPKIGPIFRLGIVSYDLTSK